MRTTPPGYNCNCMKSWEFGLGGASVAGEEDRTGAGGAEFGS